LARRVANSIAQQGSSASTFILVVLTPKVVAGLLTHTVTQHAVQTALSALVQAVSFIVKTSLHVAFRLAMAISDFQGGTGLGATGDAVSAIEVALS